MKIVQHQKRIEERRLVMAENAVEPDTGSLHGGPALYYPRYISKCFHVILLHNSELDKYTHMDEKKQQDMVLTWVPSSICNAATIQMFRKTVE